LIVDNIGIAVAVVVNAVTYFVSSRMNIGILIGTVATRNGIAVVGIVDKGVTVSILIVVFGVWITVIVYAVVRNFFGFAFLHNAGAETAANGFVAEFKQRITVKVRGAASVSDHVTVAVKGAAVGYGVAVMA
jgi:hypothetical protein